MARRTPSIPIVQTRVIGSLHPSRTGNDWRSEALDQIAVAIRTQPCEAPDHYEVQYDGLVLSVDLSEEITQSVPATTPGDVAWDDPELDLNIPD